MSVIESDSQPGLDQREAALVYERHAEKMHRYFRRRVHSDETAADLTSETFLRFIQNWHHFDPERGHPEQWLYGIARNLLRDHWRRSKVAASAQARLESEAPTITDSNRYDTVEASMLRSPLVNAVNGLTTTYREAVTMRVLDDAPYGEIGAQLGCSAATARVRVFRGLKRLDQALGPQFGEAALS